MISDKTVLEAGNTPVGVAPTCDAPAEDVEVAFAGSSAMQSASTPAMCADARREQTESDHRVLAVE
jgi:hypothetical protein